jgi:hypothetical protein
MDGRKSHNLRVFTNCLAFLFLVVIAVLLAVAKFVPAMWILGEVAKCLALFLVVLASFWYMLSKRSVVVRVLWVVCSISIAVLIFI